MWILAFVTSVSVVVVSYYFIARREKQFGGAPGTAVTDGTGHLEDFSLKLDGKLFSGIRVVELTTFIATSVCGSAMGQFGAEVIKVETEHGDPLRRFLIQYEKGRPHSTAYDISNHSKRGITLNLKRKDDLEKLHLLLEDADVFITSVRYDGLKRLKLDYESIKNRHNHLVYAHISAWGECPSAQNLPGYDIGAFWGATGMAGVIAEQKHYSVYPVGLGDRLTGMSLLGQIAVALNRAIDTGVGCNVSTSLFHSGMWSLAPYLVKGKLSSEALLDKPDYTDKHVYYSPVCRSYQCQDGPYVSILGLGCENETLQNLSKVFNTNLSLEDPKLTEMLTELFKSEPCQTIVDLLKHHNVQFTRVTTAERLFTITFNNSDPSNTTTESNKDKDEDNHEIIFKQSNCFCKIPSISDIPFVCNIPMTFSCGSFGPTRPAPKLHQHNQEVFKNGGWRGGTLPRRTLTMKSNCEFTSNVSSVGEDKLPLDGVLIVELSDIGSSVSAACCLLADQGATVVKLETEQGDYWRTANYELFSHLNRGKNSVKIDLKKDIKKLHNLLTKADVFVTNWRISKLQQHSVYYFSDDFKNRFSHLVYGLVTPWGRDGPEENRGDLGPWFSYSGLSSLLVGKAYAPLCPNYPLQYGELATSIYLASALSIALLHKKRTGEGQLVETNLLSSATYAAASLHAMVKFDPSKIVGLFQEYDKLWGYFPVCTSNCYVTKDGVWVQLLGAELERHLLKTANAFGIKWKILAGIASTVILKVLPNRKPSLMERVFPLLQYLNETFQKEIIKLTWEEASVLFKKHDIWHCKINMPQLLYDYPIAKEQNIFIYNDGGKVFVSSPWNIELGKRLPNLEVPELGQHSHIFLQ